jgi:sec-independent protein translocase protein TatB
MFDFAWSELAVIAVVALVVIGPKDLPRVMRTVGMWMSKARAIAREFQGSLDQMMREAELDEMRKQVEQASNINLSHAIERTVDPEGELQKSFEEPSVSASVAPPAMPSESPPATPPVSPSPSPAPETLPDAPSPPSAAPAKSGTHD